MNPEPIEPQLQDIQELVSYLPILHAPGFDPVERWIGGVLNDEGATLCGYPVYKAEVEAFYTAASKACWRDYEYAKKDFGRLLHDEDYIAKADMPQIKTALTASVRGQRFCDDYWAGSIEQGEIRRILQRLIVILDQRMQQETPLHE